MAVKKKPAPKRIKAGTSKASAAEKRALFVDALIANGENATEAAKAAGFSPKTAYAAGSRLLKDVEVQRLLAERRAALRKRFGLESESVCQVLSGLVHACAVDILTEKQKKQLGPLTPELRAAIVGFKFDAKGRIREIKFAEKNSAVDKAMKHLGLYKDDNDQLGSAIGRAIVVPAKAAHGSA